MIIMDLKLDNLKAFHHFHMNMAYPKKVVNSSIPEEHLSHHPNFRYKKLNIILGANATGKTSIGILLRDIFGFISKKSYGQLVSNIADRRSPAMFQIDFIPDGTYELYRLKTVFEASENGYFTNEMIHASVGSVTIHTDDNYERCASRLEKLPSQNLLWNVALEKIPAFAWYLTRPDSAAFVNLQNKANKNYLKIFDTTLKAIDPSIVKVEAIPGTDASYLIKLKNTDILIQQGEILKPELLSSGTRAGIDIADMMAWVINQWSAFFYCDEKFSYMYTDIEKAFLAVMVEKLPSDGQIFFTTYNLDILDMPYPKHSFTFLKKDVNQPDKPISCIYASDFLKRNTDSLRNAVENDLFSAAPSVDKVYELADFTKDDRL